VFISKKRKELTDEIGIHSLLPGGAASHVSSGLHPIRANPLPGRRLPDALLNHAEIITLLQTGIINGHNELSGTAEGQTHRSSILVRCSIFVFISQESTDQTLYFIAAPGAVWSRMFHQGCTQSAQTNCQAEEWLMPC
jgi:hypothetical protein